VSQPKPALYQPAKNSRQKSGPENEVVDQEAIEPVKYHRNIHAMRIPSKSPKGESHKVEGCREQREAPVHRLDGAIKQRHGDHARDRDEIAAISSLRTKNSPNTAESKPSK
jgi:hypothetical protein